MRRRRLAAIVVATFVSVSTLAAPSAPVSAHSPGGSVSGTDSDAGVDFDAGCLVDTTPSPPNAAPGANSILSPGGGTAPLSGCGVSLYDGSTETTDIVSYGLSSNGTQFTATCEVDGTVPPAGSTNPNAGDFPVDTGVAPVGFFGFGCKVMFKNQDKQTNGDNPNSGCVRTSPPGGHVRDQQGHWRDGYHNFIGYDVFWTGQEWVHRAQIGYYDPSPGGGFISTELGVDDGPVDATQIPPDTDAGFQDSITTMPSPATWAADLTGSEMTVEVNGIVRMPDTLCVGGVHERDYGSHRRGAYNLLSFPFGGDDILNVKALTIVQGGAWPPGSPYAGISDTTAGASTRGWFNTNTPNIAFSYGLDPTASDTLGPGPDCPTPEGPPNPTAAANQPCHIDDDGLPNHPITGDPARGTYRPEFWDTALDLVF